MDKLIKLIFICTTKLYYNGISHKDTPYELYPMLKTIYTNTHSYEILNAQQNPENSNILELAKSQDMLNQWKGMSSDDAIADIVKWLRINASLHLADIQEQFIKQANSKKQYLDDCKDCVYHLFSYIMNDSKIDSNMPIKNLYALFKKNLNEKLLEIAKLKLISDTLSNQILDDLFCEMYGPLQNLLSYENVAVDIDLNLILTFIRKKCDGECSEILKNNSLVQHKDLLTPLYLSMYKPKTILSYLLIKSNNSKSLNCLINTIKNNQIAIINQPELWKHQNLLGWDDDRNFIILKIFSIFQLDDHPEKILPKLLDKLERNNIGSKGHGKDFIMWLYSEFFNLQALKKINSNDLELIISLAELNETTMQVLDCDVQEKNSILQEINLKMLSLAFGQAFMQEKSIEACTTFLINLHQLQTNKLLDLYKLTDLLKKYSIQKELAQHIIFNSLSLNQITKWDIEKFNKKITYLENIINDQNADKSAFQNVLKDIGKTEPLTSPNLSEVHQLIKNYLYCILESNKVFAPNAVDCGELYLLELQKNKSQQIPNLLLALKHADIRVVVVTKRMDALVEVCDDIKLALVANTCNIAANNFCDKTAIEDILIDKVKIFVQAYRDSYRRDRWRRPHTSEIKVKLLAACGFNLITSELSSIDYGKAQKIIETVANHLNSPRKIKLCCFINMELGGDNRTKKVIRTLCNPNLKYENITWYKLIAEINTELNQNNCKDKLNI